MKKIFATRRSRRTIYTVVNARGEFRVAGSPAWTPDAASAWVGTLSQASRVADQQRSSGGPNRRCSVVALISRFGETVRVG